jgi:chromosome segregation ATPase
MGPLAWLDQRKRIKELEDVVTKLNSRMDECELDWVEMRARCKRLLDRTEKAQRYVDQAEAAVESGNTEVPQANGGATALGGRLSDHQKQVQQQILKRRAGL